MDRRVLLLPILASCATAGIEPGRVTDLVFSPGGDEVAMVIDHQELWRAPSQTPRRAQPWSRQSAGDIRDIAWAPDGIGVSLWRGGEHWLMGPSTGRPFGGLVREQMSLPQSYCATFWGPAGRLMALQTAVGKPDRLVAITPDGQQQRIDAAIRHRGRVVTQVTVGANGVMAIASRSNSRPFVGLCRWDGVDLCREHLYTWQAPGVDARLLAFGQTPGVYVVTTRERERSLYFIDGDGRGELDTSGLPNVYAFHPASGRVLSVVDGGFSTSD